MAGESNNTQTQAEVNLKYKSEGYKDAVKELKELAGLIEKIKGDLGSVTLPAIKGMNAALLQARELSSTIKSLERISGGSSVTQENAVMKKAQLDSQEKTLRVQNQLAKEAERSLQRAAFLGGLDEKKIQEHSKSIDNLKAINKGLEESAKAGKPQAELQKQVNALLQKDIVDRQQAKKNQRLAEAQIAREQRNVAIEYARQAAEGKLDKKSLTAFLNTANLSQVKALESQMKTRSLVKGFAVTPQVELFNKLVAEKRDAITGVSKRIIDPNTIMSSIASATHKGETDYIIKQLRAELNRQTKLGANRETLVGLHKVLAEARSETAKKFAPVSPFQEAKKAEEAYAKDLLKYRFNKKTIAEATRGQIEEDLKASKILSHKTLAPLGSLQYRKEMGYQKFLTDTLKARALETPEAKEAAERKRLSRVKQQSNKEALDTALSFINPNLASPAKLVEHVKTLKTVKDIHSELEASKVRIREHNIPKLSSEWQNEKSYQRALTQRLRVIQDTSKVILETDRKKIRDTTLLATLANRRTAAEKAQTKAEYDAEKRRALKSGLFTTEDSIKALKTDRERRFARDTLNFGLQTGFFTKQGAASAEDLLNLLKPKRAASTLSETDLRLKILGQQLRADAEPYIVKNREYANERQKQKARDDFKKEQAIKTGKFATEAQTKDLKGQELKFAIDSLNFGLKLGLIKKSEIEATQTHLDLLKKRLREEGKSLQINQNIARIASTGKYRTEGDIKGIKDKAEAEIARKVIAHRMRLEQMDEAELKRQQKLLDTAKSRDHLLTAQANRQDRERQNERRLNTVTHLEGDGGASMAVVQAGFMMRSQVLGGLSSIFSGAFDSAIQLDKAFRNLQAISASTNYEMATMKINLINVAQASKFSAAEVGETAVMLAQAGLSIQEIGASMKGIITLAQATGTDLAKSVDVVTSVLSIFNKSATETDTIVNQLTAALNESKLDINKMALGLQYAGNIANDSGVSFEELTAALGATANAGIRSGSTLGTGLRQMFIDLQKPNEKLTKRLETLGVTLDQVNFRSQGLEGVLRNLRNAGFSSADAFETFEVRSAAAFSALSGNLTDFHDLQEELADTNAAFDANNVQMEAFAVQLDHLKSNLGVMAAEGLKPVTAMLRDWTKGLAHSMENAEEGAGIIQLLTGAFAALMVGVTITWFTRLAWEIGKLTLAMGGLRALSGATTFGILGIVAALGTGIASWISYRSEVERLNTALDKAKGEHNNLKAALQSSEGTLNNVDEALKNLVDRYGVLKEDSGQTQTAAKNLMAQFEEFGLKIDDVANISIDNLIQKIQDLRSELSKDLKEKISDTATAKVKEILTEKSTAQGKLKQAKIFSGYFDFTSEGYKKFEQATNPSGSDPLGMSAFGRNPEFRKLYLQFFQGALRTQAMGKMLPPSEFSAPELKAKMQDLLAKSPNLSSTDIRILQEALDDLSLNYEDIRTVNTAQERISKTRKQEERDLYTLESDDFSKSAFGGEGRSSAVARNFSETLNKLTKIKDPRTRRKEQAIAAEQALKDSQAIISEAENEIKTLETNKADSHQILTKQGQIARMREAEFEYRKYIKENDAQKRKRQLQVLGFDLDAAKDAVATAKAIWSKSTGLNTEEKTYKEYEAKILAQQEVEDRINALKLIDNPDEDIALEAVKRSRTSEKTKRGVERNSFRKHIEDTAAKTAVDTQEARSRQALEDKKREQDRFFKELENKDKFVKMQEEAERRQAKARAYIPLDSGSMFDTLNADEKKAAQAKANATGVSQEYSVFGQTANRFARQAARFDNQQLEKNLIQRQLANEVGALALLQQKERNINQEDYTKLVEKEAKLKAELKVLEDRAANSRLDQDKEALERKQKEYDLTRDQILAAQNYEETLKEKIEERKNSIEALKETLQALNDQYDLMDTTLTAGVQSMTSGLSSVFTDWASGVIKNTHDVKEAFRSLGQSVLQSMAKVVSDRIAQQFMGFLLNGLGSAFGVPKASPIGSLGFETPSLGVINTASTGGLITPTGVKHFSSGGPVGGGPYIGRDSVPAYLDPREYVVQASAVEAVGVPFMQSLNNITKSSLSQGASALGTAKPMVQNVMKASPPVNVYVVSPEQQRQMGQEDVVVALQDDILRGGTTKKLIKAVISGEV